MMEVYLSRSKSNISYRTSAKPHNYQKYKTVFEKSKAYWVGISVFIPADWDMSMDSGGGIILDFHDRSYKDPSWRRGLPLAVRITNSGFQIHNRDGGCDEKTVNCKVGNKIKTFAKSNITMKQE